MKLPSISSLYERFLSESGTTMSLTRTGVTALSFRGVMQDLSEKDLVGEAQQGDRKVILGTSELVAAAWPQPIRQGDKIVCLLKTYTVQAADAISIDGTVVRYNLIVRG